MLLNYNENLIIAVDVQQLLTCNTVSSGEQLPQKYATKTISNVLIKTTVKGGYNNIQEQQPQQQQQQQQLEGL